MFRKKKKGFTRFLAAFLSILLVTYTIPTGMMTVEFAETQDTFSLQILDQNVPVAAEQVVTAQNDQTAANAVTASGKTDADGVVQFPDLTTVQFGENNYFQFSMGDESFSIYLANGTTDRYTYDLETKQVTPEKYNVNFVPNGAGSGKLTINGTDYTGPALFAPREDVDVQITPDEGSTIQSVTIGTDEKTVTGSGSYSGTIKNISANTTIEVSFALKNVDITFNSFENGSITDADNQPVNPGETVSEQYGSTPEFMVTPDEGYHIASITVGGEPENLSEEVTQKTQEYPLKLKALTQNQNVAVTFEPNSYEITFHPFSEGNYYDGENKIINTSAGKVIVNYEYGSTPSFTVKPKDGFHVEDIMIDETSVYHSEENVTIDVPYTLDPVKDNVAVSVTLAVNIYNVTTKVNDKNYGKISVDPTKINHGQPVNVTVIPTDNSYQLAELKVAGEKVDYIENYEGSIVTYTYTIPSVQSDTEVAAVFEPVQITTDSWEQYIKVSSEPIKQYTDKNNNDILIFPYNAQLQIDIVSSLYDKVDFSKDLKNLVSNGMVGQSISIDTLIVKGKSGKSKQINLTKKLYLLFDKAQPTVEKPELTSSKGTKTVKGIEWYSGTVTVDGTITNHTESKDGVDYSSNIAHVYYSKADDPNDTPKDALDPDDNNHYQFEITDHDYEGKYKVWAVDDAGNSFEQLVDVNIDNTNPTLEAGIFDDNNPAGQTDTSLWEKVLNFLPFGNYFNQKIQVTVKVKDEASGVQDVSLKAITKNPGNAKPTIEEVPGSFNGDQKQFTIDSNQFEGTFEVEVTDNVTNTYTYPLDPTNSNLAKNGNGMVMFEKQSPEIKMDVKPNTDTKDAYFGKDSGNEYYNGDVTYHLDVADHESGVNNVNLKVNGQNYKDKEYSYSKEPAKQEAPAIADINTAELTGAGYALEDEGSYTVSVDAEDNAGNNNQDKPETRTVFIDTEAPELDGAKDAVTLKQESDNNAVKFEKVYDGPFFNFLHFMSFGTFFNEKITVTVKAKDAISGIEKITLNAVPQDGSAQVTPNLESFTPTSDDSKTAEAVFSLDVTSFKGTFNVQVTDHVGNTNQDPYVVSAANSNIDENSSGIIMIERDAPTASINVEPKPGDADLHSYQAGGKEFYNHDVVFNIPVEDKDSGVNKVVINDVDGTAIKSDTFTNQQKFQESYSIHSDETSIDPEGFYHLSLAAIDNAGNVTGDPGNLVNSDKSYKVDRTIYIDRTPPEIMDFAFSKGGNASKDDIVDSVEPTDYGFYFMEPTDVTITAADHKAVNEAASGVHSMTVFVRDYEKNQYYAVKADGSLSEISGTNLDMNKVEDIVQPILASDDKVTFRIPGNFKGQIFAKATDNVTNTGTSLKSPTGQVIENAEKHNETASILIDKEKTNYKDNNGLDLYAKDVPVTLTVKDSYSGIAQIHWEITAPYDTAENKKGTVTIDNKKQASGDTGWEETNSDRNLVIEMTKTILVNHDSNNITIHVTMIDRVGNKSEKDLTFSIDKSAPTVDVTYDNNTPDSQYSDHYKEDRTATIVVTERNFRSEDFQYQISNKDGEVPKITGWMTEENKQDPNKTTHTATIRYNSDGDYTFNLQYKDNAANAAAPFGQQTFTIDKTVPVVNVSYNNNAASNGNYYKSSRTATITIKEHNFDSSRVKVTGTASDNGKTASFPTVSGWTANGDNHTATIQYSADGNYSFDIDFNDKASNNSADYKAEEFVVDQTAPKLEITGVNDQSANKGDVIPVISYSDTNFNKNAVSIKLTGANLGEVKPDGSNAEAANGQVFTFKNFAKDQKVDDIYTLTAALTDFAGNQSTQTVRFSVNRFGSVYVFDDSLKNLEGKYVKEEKDVVLTEVNVDSLKHESINLKMTKNGDPSDLVEGKDFTVSHSGGNGKWSEYKYVISKKLFSDDGKYTVTLYSEDSSGNINQNIDAKKKAEISFGVDKTAPVILPADLENGKQYAVDKKPVSVSVKDNLVLVGADVYLNGKKVESKVEGENYTFTIPSSNSKQNVKIVSTDAAGNKYEKTVKDFLVSTNLFVRLYNNTPVFASTLSGVGVVGFIAIFLAAKKMRKEEEEE